MPTSKQARAAQARRKAELAESRARRSAKKRRNRRIGATIGVLFIVGAVLLAFTVGVTNNGSSSKSSPPATTATNVTSAPVPTSTPPTTAAALASAKGKPCVAMKGAPPKGAPSVPVQVGPPPTKLVVKDLKAGTGAVAKAGDTITASYIGVACSTGQIFGASVTDGQDFTAALKSPGIIAGWVQGIPGMKVGGERLLGIPPALAYGTTGRAPIAPDEALWFVIDLRKVGS